MTELEHFERVWGSYPPFNGQHGDLTKLKYQNILFSIWKHHPDYQDEGFQIKSRNRTFYRVIDLAVEAGLLKMVKNYLVGKHTRMFHKNNILFDMIFRDGDNPYGKWLDEHRKDRSMTRDFVSDSLLERLEDEKTINIKPARTSLKIKKKLNYDLDKLKKQSETMVPYYYDLLLKMNRSVVHDDFKFLSFIYFDGAGLPSGRPYNYFSSTLNDKKKHKVVDGSMEFRSDFLRRVGLLDHHEVYDIKSEIPRVNHLFHTGEWKDDDYDFYSAIIDDTGMFEATGETITRGGSKYSAYEDSMKQIFMRIYFRSGSDRQAWRSGYIVDRLEREDIKKGKKTVYIEFNSEGYSFTIDRYGDFFKALENDEDLNLDIWSRLSKSTDEIVGPPLGNLIFWYSFFIETEVKIELLNRGKVVYNVYDGFYFNSDIQDEIRGLLRDKAEFVYDNFMLGVKL